MQPGNIVRVNQLKEHTSLADSRTHWESVMFKAITCSTYNNYMQDQMMPIVNVIISKMA